MLATQMQVKQKLPPHLWRMAEVMRVTADFSQLADMNRQGLRFPVEGTGGSLWGSPCVFFCGNLTDFQAGMIKEL